MMIRLISTLALAALMAIGGYVWGSHDTKASSQEPKKAFSGSTPYRKLHAREETVRSTDELLQDLLYHAEGNERTKLKVACLRLAKLPLSALEEALEKAEALEEEGPRKEALKILIGRWAELDPLGAAQFSLLAKDREEVAFLLFETAKVWAKEDPAGAYRFYEELPMETKNYKAYELLGEGIFAQWVSLDPVGAFRKAARLQGVGWTVSRWHVAKMLKDDALRDSFVEMTLALEDPGKQRDLLIDGVSHWSNEENFLQVAEWIDRQGLSASLNAGLERAAVRSWVKSDPRKAAEWLLSRADEASYSEHLQTVVADWSWHHPGDCSDWLLEQELGPETDQAVATFARRVSSHDYEGAASWVMQISEPKERLETMDYVMRGWGIIDPEVAGAYLDHSDFSEADKGRLRRRIQEPRE